MSGVFAVLTILATGVVIWYLVRPKSQTSTIIGSTFTGLSQLWQTALSPKQENNNANSLGITNRRRNLVVLLQEMKTVAILLAVSVVVWWVVKPGSTFAQTIGGLIGTMIAYIQFLVGGKLIGS